MRDHVILSTEQLHIITRRIGRQLTARLKDEEKVPVLLCTLAGATMFFADVVRNVKCPVYLDFIKVKSYEGTKSTGELKIIHDVNFDLRGRTVVIVEDVVDTGLTMYHLKNYLYKKYSPKQILIASLFDKKPLRKLEVDVDFIGKEIEEPLFLMGYGLDYCELDRNTPFVYCAEEDDLERMDVDRQR